VTKTIKCFHNQIQLSYDGKEFLKGSCKARLTLRVADGNVQTNEKTHVRIDLGNNRIGFLLYLLNQRLLLLLVEY
jgi:hypothetical protein